MQNEFGSLDAQSEVSAFAKMTPEELAEYSAWIDWRNSMMDAAEGIVSVQVEIPECGICGGEHRTCDCIIPHEHTHDIFPWFCEEPEDLTDQVCPTCGDPDCNRPFSHPLDEHDGEDCFPYNVHDLSDDADALASAGLGTDEDYEHNCVEDQYLDASYEDRFDLD